MSKNTFKLAVVGCGRWGLNHVRTAHKILGSGFALAADISESREKAVADISPNIKFTTDVQSVIKDTAVNSIVIATPAETHFQLAKLALENGKHVLVEKPIALFSTEARELETLAQKHDRILMVGHLLLFHPAIRKIKQLIDEGVLGKLQYIYSNRLNLGTVRKEENILWSFAPHDISVLQYFTGSDPLTVNATGGMFLQPGIHDVTLTTLEYPNNVQAHIHVSWLHPFKEHRLVVIGDKSMVVFEDSKPAEKLVLYPKGIDWVNGEPIKRDEGFEVVEYKMEPPLDAELTHFQECVINGKQPLSDGENGIKVLEILEEAQGRLENHLSPTGRNGKAASSPETAPFFVHETAVVDDGCEVGENTKIWHFSHVQSGSKIGKNCSLGQNVNIANNVKIGDYVKIQNNVSVYEGVELEDYVFCGPSMVFTNVLNPRCEFPQRGSEHYTPTKVGYGASIGANATIVCGTKIGKFAFIGAGAVVTKDVPEYALMVGNPGKIAGWMCRCGTKLMFNGASATCQNCQRKYHKNGEVVEVIAEEVVI